MIRSALHRRKEIIVDIRGQHCAFCHIQIRLNHQYLNQFAGTAAVADGITKGVFRLVSQEKAVMGKRIVGGGDSEQQIYHCRDAGCGVEFTEIYDQAVVG